MQVVGGVLIHQTRHNVAVECSNRFSKLYVACSAASHSSAVAVTLLAAEAALRPDSPFGRDPTFNPASALFDAELRGREGDYFNTSAGSPEVSIFAYPFAFFTRRIPYQATGFPVVLQVRLMRLLFVLLGKIPALAIG